MSISFWKNDKQTFISYYDLYIDYVVGNKTESQNIKNNGFTSIFLSLFHQNTNIVNNRVYVYHFKVEVFLMFTEESSLVG